MPVFVRQALVERGLMEAFRGRPPYQQNDYLGWINRAKRKETGRKGWPRCLTSSPAATFI